MGSHDFSLLSISPSRSILPLCGAWRLFSVEYKAHFICRSIVICDGFVTSACYGIEPKTHTAMTEYFGDRPVCYFGPLAPPPQEVDLNRKELTQATEPNEVEIFMERVLRERGKKSLLYVNSTTRLCSSLGA